MHGSDLGAGKELRELMKKQSGGDKESDVEEEEGEGEEDMETESPEEKRKGWCPCCNNHPTYLVPVCGG